ncbi:MAG: hypothetical protein HC773_01430, partial [Scytonema sp. CRU_2_7]|nr:hypothetical protein [Scytonema sp. CRU_2_7]
SSKPLGTLNTYTGANISPDSLGNLWFATNEGLAKYDTNLDVLTLYTTLDGLESNTPKIVAVDFNDDVWVSQPLNIDSSNPNHVTLQRFNHLTSTFTDFTYQDVFGVKAFYGGCLALKVNPFDGKIFVGENYQSGFTVLSRYDGISWAQTIISVYGLPSLDLKYIEFETANKWWLGGNSVAPGNKLVLWDNGLLSSVYSFDNIDFGGNPINGIAVLSTNVLLVTDSVGATYRVTVGVISNTGVILNTFFYNKAIGDLLWTIDNLNIDIKVFDDVTTTEQTFIPATVGGSNTTGMGYDVSDYFRAIRLDGLDSILILGEPLLPPVFTASYIREVEETTVDIAVTINQNGTAYFVIVPDGDTAPTSTQVKNGEDSSSTPVNAGFFDSVVLTANVENLLSTFTGFNLDPGTDYDLYLVAESAGGLQLSPTKIDFTTFTPDPGALAGIIENITTGGMLL